MTDYNERLGEILSDFRQSSLIINASNSLGAGERGREAFAQSLDEAKQAILDWHNKQTTKELDAIMEWHEKEVEALLDRLESQLQDPNNVDFYDEDNNSLMSLGEWLLLERNKLKESRNDQP